MKPCLLEKFVWHLILSMDKTSLRSTSRHQFQFPSHPFHGKVWSSCVLMATSVSRQDEPNPALWLATRAEKMELSCPLGISRLVSQDQRSFLGVLSHIINPLLTKLVWSRWLDLGLVLDRYPAILTSRLINNSYILNRRPSQDSLNNHCLQTVWT